MKKEIYKIFWHIVEKKDKLELDTLDSGNSNTLVLSVAGEDHGRIVGSRGRTIEMLQDLVESYYNYKDHGTRWRLILESPNTSSWGIHREFEPVKKFDINTIKDDLLSFVYLFSDVSLSTIDTGSVLIFEFSEIDKKTLKEETKKAISFLTIAMCKGYGKNASVEFF